MNAAPTFDEAFSPESLRRIWRRIQNKHFDIYRERAIVQTGADGVQFDHFVRDADKHFAAMHRKAIESRYTFAPLLEIEKDKPGSKEKRIISISSIRDTIVQTALYNYLYPLVDPLLTESVYGYRKGRNAHSAIRRIQEQFGRGQTCVFDADFSKFFDSVDHEIMFEKLSLLDHDPRAAVLFRRFLKTGRITALELEKHTVEGKQTKLQPVARRLGLPQGGVLSGLASNLYLAGFDDQIVGLQEGYVRYADDFVVCCDSPSSCSEIHEAVKRYAADLKLSLNVGKTHECVTADDGLEFLGFKVTATHVQVRGKNISRFKHRVTGVIRRQHPQSVPEATLRRLAWRLSYKIRGPTKGDIDELAHRGLVQHPHRRCWVGFFRIVTDDDQIRTLDRWVRSQIAAFMWRTHHVRVRYRDMRAAGLPSLIAAMHRARRKHSPQEFQLPTSKLP